VTQPQKILEEKWRRAHPCPILTRLRYNRVGSASVQICCKRLTISASFALSSFFFSRRRGVAPAVFAKLATAGLCCCGAVGGWGARRSATGTFTAVVACDFDVRSAVEALGDSRVGALTAAGGAGERRSLVVFERTSVSLRGGLGADRWEVDLSKLGCAGWGGDGAGRYDPGAWDADTVCGPPE
jgi:hypothetical protein